VRAEKACRDGSWSSVRSLTIIATPAAPALSSPANGSETGDTTPRFSWSSVSGATSYRIQVDNNAGFGSPEVDLTTSNLYYTPAAPLSLGTHYWRVRAINTCGGSWSSSRTVTIAGDEFRVYLPLVVRGHVTGEPPSGGIVNGDFEQGKTGWTEYSTHGWSLILSSGFPPGVTARSGSWAAWLGGDNSETSYIEQAVTVPASQPYLHYWHWIQSSDYCGYDVASVRVNGTAVDSYDLCQTTATAGWVEHTVNLSAYAGQSATLQLRVTTDSSYASSLFIDDVSFQASVGADAAGATPSAGDDKPTGPETVGTRE
jgi:hypothetical protein